MNLQESIAQQVTNSLESGVIEKAIKENISKYVQEIIEDMFKWGKAKDVIKEKLESVLIPQLEQYDYSEHIVKLDDVLTEILKNTTLDNKKILNNFKEYMLTDIPKELKLSAIFDRYGNFVSNNAKTDGLEIDYDDKPSYEPVEITYEVNENEDRDWSIFQHAMVYFECEHDKEMNFQISLMKYKKDNYWTINYEHECDLRSLRRLDKFNIYLMQLDQQGTHIQLDDYSGSEEVELESEPECYFE